ncbi:MAG: class I SAM-dependent methyltransferase [Patescibacteria group bacterium]|jgi:hypothetical protein
MSQKIIKKITRGLKLSLFRSAFYPGHFYSPLPSLSEIKRANMFFDRGKQLIRGISFNEKAQIKLLKDLKKYSLDCPFPDTKKKNFRYFFLNDSYSFSDGNVLYSMIRHLTPKRIIEVGSGYSTCLILDTNDLYYNNRMKCKFIEPYPKKVFSLIHEEDRKRVITKPTQKVDLSLFKQLENNDILFIDSSHVSKFSSDVNHLFFNILPRLNQGVYVHFHDIFFPFEYPAEWIKKGFFWNESYLLRSFLMYNSEFEVVFSTNYLSRFYKKQFESTFPSSNKCPGASFWIRKKSVR